MHVTTEVRAIVVTCVVALYNVVKCCVVVHCKILECMRPGKLSSYSLGATLSIRLLNILQLKRTVPVSVADD